MASAKPSRAANRKAKAVMRSVPPAAASSSGKLSAKMSQVIRSVASSPAARQARLRLAGQVPQRQAHRQIDRPGGHEYLRGEERLVDQRPRAEHELGRR